MHIIKTSGQKCIHKITFYEYKNDSQDVITTLLLGVQLMKCSDLYFLVIVVVSQSKNLSSTFLKPIIHPRQVLRSTELMWTYSAVLGLV